MSSDLERMIQEAIKKYLPLSSEEIYRLKQYARDENYSLYITNRSTILKTIEMTQEAYQNATKSLQLSKEALNYADMLHRKLTELNSIVDATKQRVDILNSQVAKASQQIDYLQSMTDALKKAQLTLKSEIDTAKKRIHEISKNMVSLQQAIANAWDQLDKIINKMKTIGLDMWDEIIGKRILVFAQKMNSARQKIYTIWDKAKDDILAVNGKVEKTLSQIGSPDQEGTILYELKNRVLAYIDKIGTAHVDYSKLDGTSTYEEKGNTGKGIVLELAKMGWDMGQFIYNMNNLIEKRSFHWDVPVVNYRIGFELYVPRPDRLYEAVKWIFNTVYDPISQLVSKFQDLQSYTGKVFEPLQWLVAKLSELESYSGEYIRIIYDALQKTINVLLDLFSLPKQEVAVEHHLTNVPRPILPYATPKPPTAKGIKGTIPPLAIIEGPRHIIKLTADGKVSEIENVSPTGKILKRIPLKGAIAPY